jgi:hypothetical protein
MTTCREPGCRAPAEIYARADLADSTGAVVPHARILCLSRHFFCMLTETLPSLVMPRAALAAKRGRSPARAVTGRDRPRRTAIVPGSRSWAVL